MGTALFLLFCIQLPHPMTALTDSALTDWASALAQVVLFQAQTVAPAPCTRTRLPIY